MFFFLNALHNNKYLTVLYLIGLIKGSHNSYKPDMKEIIDQIRKNEEMLKKNSFS